MPVLMDVRTSVRKEGIPRKSEGKVMGYTQDGRGAFVDFGDGQQVVFAMNELENLDVQASHGEVERTRMQQGIEYARTGLPEEMLQLRCHLRDLIDGGYSPMYMERHLVTDLGFNSNLFRDAFQKVAGFEFEDALNFPYYEDAPGSIPTMNLGWGRSKDGKTLVFIMAGTTDYMCVRQVDDMHRHELHRHKTLPEAVECAKKLTKKLMRWNPPVKEIKNSPIDPSQMYRQQALFRQAMQHNPACQELCDRLSNMSSLTHRKEAIDALYLAAGIDQTTHKQFLKIFCDDPKAELEGEAVKEVAEEAVEDALKAPRGNLNPGPDANENVPVGVSEIIAQVLEEKNQQLRNFALKQTGMEISMLGLPPKEMAKQIGEDSVTAATALVKLYLDVTDKSAPDSPKHALMAFTVTGNKVKESNDSIKDIETSKIYGLTDEGLSDYFGK